MWSSVLGAVVHGERYAHSCQEGLSAPAFHLPPQWVVFWARGLADRQDQGADDLVASQVLPQWCRGCHWGNGYSIPNRWA